MSLFSPPLSHSNFISITYFGGSLAFPARPSSVAPKGIFFSILVTVNAVGLFSFFCHKTIPPHYVLSMRNSLEMIRVYAKFVLTKVIQFKSRRNGPVFDFVAKSVCLNSFSRHSKSSVSAPIFTSGPYPTGFRFFNFRPKSVSRGRKWFSHDAIVTLTGNRGQT